jgi:hypothetical protein
MSDTFKYYAFISYNAKDTAWGKRLQKKLEHFKLPATLCSEHGWKRKPIRPVFFAPTDIQPGGLSNELRERLKASHHLIVICSPNSAKSEWVGKEIEFFHSLGRTNNIHLFIVDGTPHSGNPETECFNPVIDRLGLPEILGANIHEKIYRWPKLNKERAYVQLISKLLGVEFDAIWQRHKRALTRKVVAWTLGGVAVICALVAVWRANQPEDIVIRLDEASVHNDQLPPLKDAIITMTLKNETKTDTIVSLDNSLTFTNIPHRYLKAPAHFTVTCRNFIETDTTLQLTKHTLLEVHRDPKIYGEVHFILYDPNTEDVIPNSRLEIDGHETYSDENGQVSLFIPLEQQKKAYSVTATFPLESSTVVMPCGSSDVISKKQE